MYSYFRRLIQDPFFGAVFSLCFVWPRITSLMYVPLLLLLQIPLPVTDVGHIQMKIHCSLILYSLVLTLLTHLVRFSNNFQLLELPNSLHHLVIKSISKGIITNVLGMNHFEIFWENRPTLASEFVYHKVLLKNLRAEQDARHHMVKCNLERNICYTLLSPQF